MAPVLDTVQKQLPGEGNEAERLHAFQSASLDVLGGRTDVGTATTAKSRHATRHAMADRRVREERPGKKSAKSGAVIDRRVREERPPTEDQEKVLQGVAWRGPGTTRGARGDATRR